MKKYFEFSSNRLARRLALYVVLASTFLTIFTSAFQLFEIYKTHISHIEVRLNEIRDSYSDNVASRVWVANQQELEQTLQGILRLQDIEHIAVYEGTDKVAELGAHPKTDTIERNFLLHYTFRGEVQQIGQMHITASLADTYQDLIDQALTIITTNAVKTFFISGFMLFLFYHLAAKHIRKIAEYAEGVSIHNLDRLLKLDRKDNTNKHHDEFDLLVNSVHAMQQNLATSVSELAKKENNLAQTLDSIGDAVITTDTKGLVTRMNHVAENLTGWQLSEAAGKPIKTIFPIVNATSRMPIENPVKKVLSTGETVYLSNHTTLLAKDGTEHQIADSAAPIRDGEKILGMVLVFNDVTEQYHLRETAAKSKRDLQAIMNHSPAVIYVKDIKGHFTFINQQFEKLFHIERDTIIGKTLHDIFPNEIAEQMQTNDKAVLTAGHAIESEETAPQDDGPHIYSSVKFPLFNEENNIYAICGISTDITEKRQQDEQFRRSQKMEALGKLTGGIAHDYNNLLGIIIGYAELLSHQLSNDTTLEKYVQDIQRAANRGTKLTKKLLAFTRHKTLDASVLNINELLNDQRLMLEKTLTARIALSYKQEENLWPVWLDGSDLEDTIINISINAMHAITGNGTLTIHTQNEQLTSLDAQQLNLASGDYVLLSITDTGAGMTPEIRDKIFDPFFSTKGERGTGLGLSQVYGFVERSNGAIKVYSEQGHGTRLAFYFPRCKEALDVTPTPTASEKQNYRGHETLLVVDDEAPLVELAKEILIGQGYRILTANDGLQALAILENEPVDMVISDVIMPNMDGYQLAAEIQKCHPQIKFQMVSGFTDDRNDHMTDNSLHLNLLYKPYTSKTLLTHVRTLLDADEPTDEKKSKNHTILIMDDEEDIRNLFSLNLKKLGYQTVLAKNGTEAISLYQNSLTDNENISVVILDLTIPGDISGKDTAAKIRALAPHAKTIVSSGDSSAPEMTHCHNHNFDGALEKNFDLEKLKDVLEEVLAK